MSRLLGTAIAVLAGTLLAAGCSPQGETPAETPAATPTSIQAFPDVPHFRGELAVRLQPALPLVTDTTCVPSQAAGVFCTADGQGTFRALGEGRPATVVEVRTGPTSDHTAWDTVVRFDPTDRPAVREAAEQAGGLGGRVLVMAGDRLVAVIEPPAFGNGRASLLGLEKPQAWAFVEAFASV